MESKAKVMTPKDVIQGLLEAVGIELNGKAPWDVQIHNENLFSRVLKDGSLGLGEAYMDKWWDCERLDIFFYKILGAEIDARVKIPLRHQIKLLLTHFMNFQTKNRAKKVADQHYDLGNALFTSMLDKRMMYSCGYFKEAQTLDEAQEAKLELICRKLKLQSGMRLLDIGCGFGGLARYAAEKHQVEVIGVTISKQQYDYAKEYCQGLPIEIRLQDYRDIHDQVDRVVSVGMFEHVGLRNYAHFMEVVQHTLPDQGLFLLHTIGGNQAYSLADEWIAKYIFPNGTVPTIAQIAFAAERRFVVENLHNFGAYYDNTLLAWHANFIRHWESLKQYYDERFYRMWTSYLLSCAGSFRARKNQVWQIVFSKNGVSGEYSYK
jgi:cyclopropane-fatty-acyl-phospholipid synthase